MSPSHFLVVLYYECLPIEGVYQSYVVFEISSLPDDFQKEKFINFIIANDQS
jgi:hypothetical protein